MDYEDHDAGQFLVQDTLHLFLEVSCHRTVDFPIRRLRFKHAKETLLQTLPSFRCRKCGHGPKEARLHDGVPVFRENCLTGESWSG
jgi:hypothetical protein